MKMNQLHKNIALLLATTIAGTMATTAMAGTVNNSAMKTGQLTERTGEKLTNLTTSVYQSLTGKTVDTINVNHPVSLYDYQQADSAYEDAYLNGALNVKDSKGTKTSYDVAIGVDYEKVMSSADANTKYEADVSALFADDGNDDTEKTKNYTAHASANYDRYFDAQASNAFWYGKGEARIQQEDPKDYAGIKNPEITVSAGLGYGRVVNVTPMAQAMRLVEALIENGSLSRVPSASTYQKVVQIISQKEMYQKNNPARYAQYWVADIEKALGINLGASGTIRAYDVLTKEKISTRKHGWDVRAGAGVVASDFAGEHGKPLLELQANYHLPVSNRTQFSNEARLSAQLDDNDSYVFSNDMGWAYELTDRVDWENKWKFAYEKNDGSNDIIRNTLTSSFLYEISNSLDYKTSLGLSHVDVKDGDSSFDKSLFMGVSYRMK